MSATKSKTITIDGKSVELHNQQVFQTPKTLEEVMASDLPKEQKILLIENMMRLTNKEIELAEKREKEARRIASLEKKNRNISASVLHTESGRIVAQHFHSHHGNGKIVKSKKRKDAAKYETTDLFNENRVVFCAAHKCNHPIAESVYVQPHPAHEPIWICRKLNEVYGYPEFFVS